VALRRGVGCVVSLLVLACIVSAAGLVAVWYVVTREPSVSQNSTLVLRLDTDLHEASSDDVVRQFIGGNQSKSLRSVIDDLRKAKVDKRIGAVVIAPSALKAPFWGKIQELRDAILDYRRSGKPAIAYLEYADDRIYYLATACSRIYLMPTAQLDVNGVASYEVFFRGTLDLVGAYPDFLHVGEYKTAANQFTEKTFTPAHREMSESLERDTYEQLVKGIAAGRRKSEAEVRALIDQGPFLPQDAQKAGLVDRLAYHDQLDDTLKADPGVKLPGGALNLLESKDYAKVPTKSLGLDKGPKIALIQAFGVITSGESGFDPVNGAVLGSDTIIKYIREAREDDAVKAIVVRVDSPGGSAVASDAIWRELSITRDQKPSRPLVVSMSDLAASGGYYIAMAAPYIVAQPGTLTGSIGVITGKFVTAGTWAKLGANMEALSIGRNAEMSSPIRPFNESERAKVQAGIEAFYDGFVEKAAHSRHMAPDKLEGLARGRVWTGKQAKEIGLVDSLGGLDAALAVAKQRARIAPDAQVEVVVYPPKRSFYELVSESLSSSSDSRAAALLGAALPDDERRAIGLLSAPMRIFKPGEMLAIMPALISR
jgi:protease-4